MSEKYYINNKKDQKTMPNNFKLGKVNNKFVNSKSYKNLRNIIVATSVIFMMVYAFRTNLYELNNQPITLFAETAPNLFVSFLFTLIGMFFILPVINNTDPISNPKIIWIINALNIIIFSLIEYIHVALNLASWDNNDIIASLIGILLSTAIYFKLRKSFLGTYYNEDGN